MSNKRHAVLTCGFTSYPQFMSVFSQIISLRQIVIHRLLNMALTCGFTQSLDKRGTLSNAPRATRAAQAVGGLLLGALCLFQTVSPAGASELTKQPTFKDYLKIYAHSKIVVESQYKCFNRLMERESKWSHTARNGSHYGIGQMRSLWYKKLNAYQQIDASIAYITKRYGHSCAAWAFSNKRGYY